jgi:hypothetical protein
VVDFGGVYIYIDTYYVVVLAAEPNGGTRYKVKSRNFIKWIAKELKCYTQAVRLYRFQVLY